MKVKLVCDSKDKDKILDQIKRSDFTLNNDDPDIMIIDLTFQKDYIIGTNDEMNYIILNAEEIEFVEVIDNVTYAQVSDKRYIVDEKLYMIEGLFSTKGFVRASKSVVINIKHIKTIKPSYNTKFILTMKCGAVIDVTRTYYYMFKKYLGL